jgi:thiol:disulfide interchange protein
MRKTLKITVPILVLLIAGLMVLRLFFGPAPVPDVFLASLSLDEAHAKSAATNKPVFVLATADWCPPCQLMKRVALRDERVAAAIREKTIPVYFDATDNTDDEVLRIARDIGIGSLPAMVLIRDGEEISRKEGYQSALELLSWLDQL